MTTQIADNLPLCSAKTPEGNLSPEFLQQLKSLFNLSTFIETGTFMGDTTEIARQIYSHVESIELSEGLCAQAKARFKLCPNVRVHQGDSTTVLPTLLPATAGRGLLWLDAHYSEGVTAKGEKNTPILEELQAIKNTGRSDFIVLIDDLRLFQPVTRDLPVDSSLHGYPSLVEIFEALLDIDPSYNFYVFGDVALAFVEDQRVRVSDVVRACTVSRVFDSPDFPVEDLLQAEQVIANAQGAERQELAALADRFTANETLGLGQHYRLWLGLLHHQQGASSDAIHAFQRSIELGLDHWRVHYYLAEAAIAAGEMDLAESEAHIAQSMMPAQSAEMEPQQPTPAPVIDRTGPSTLNQLINNGAWRSGEPLHLHLGCGEQYLDGYINIDYPQDAHNVMIVKADYYDNLMTLKFPKGSVDEIRLHHVFEHFDRATALALLIRWQEWLKVGGVLHIETPDLMGCARILLSDVSAKVKSGITRHLAGDQSAPWAYHLDLWYPERFEDTFTKMGFSNVEIQSWSWPHEPFLSNVNAVARKSQNLEREILIRAADDLLANSMVAPSETPTLATWKEKLRIALDSETTQPPINIPQIATDQPAGQTGDPMPSLATKVPQDYLYDFNQRDRDQWVVEKANSIPAGSKLLDVGAGTCPYRNLFAQCDYQSHDFGQYEGVKLGGDTQYGAIDYVSDIVSIPVPDNSFDVVLCTEVLEHVPEPIEALREMSRVLKPGGRLLVTAPLGSGLHQLPYHYYGGYTPEWYRTFGKKFGLGIQEITPNGGFFHLLAQECVRAAHLIPETDLLDRKDTDFVRGMLADWLPQYLFQLEEHSLIDQFTIGYHVDAIKLKEKAEYKPENGQSQTVPQTVAPKVLAQQPTTAGVIFSKDRPLQLDATIASFKARCRDASSVELNVIYATSSEPMEQAYAELAAQYSDVGFIRERAFKNDLISIVQGAKQILLLVDDCVFVRDFAIQDYIQPLTDNPSLIGASLRLGRNTTYCYSLDRMQSVPALESLAIDVNAFAWPAAQHDFAYPLEVSSSVYRSELMLPLLTQLEYTNPNTLEAALAAVAPQLAEVCNGLVCPDSSIAFCIPVNIVQKEYDNRAGERVDDSAEALANKFSEGYRVDIDAFLGFTPNACHQEIQLPLKKNSENPLVSIVIPCYNQAEFLADAVSSVVAQTFSHWECIIVNDGSTDSTAEIGRQLREQYASANIRLVEQANLGLSAARNTGIGESRGKYILPLDADDKLAATYLEETVAVLQERPDVDIVYVDEHNFGIRDHVHVKGVSSLEALKNGNVHDYCSLYRKPVWEAVGGYSPAMFLGGEDWNFWLAAAKAGFRSYHHSRPLFFYRNREESMVTMTLASIHEVYAHVIYHHPEVFGDEHQQWAKEHMAASTPENRERALKYFAKHPENALLQKIVNVMGLDTAINSGSTASVPAPRADQPLVSCIVPTMNRPNLLVRALESLVAQSYENWEAVVVNDAGGDVRDLVERIDPRNRIHYIRHNVNKGLSAARNTGIWASSGELLCYLDDDDRFMPEHIATLVQELQLQAADFIYSEATYVHEEVRNGVTVEVGRSTPYSDIGFSKDRLDITNFIPVNTWIHRRELIEQVGFFDTELKALEDWDMLLRFSRATEFVHLPQLTVEVYHRVDSFENDHMLSRERKNIPELHRRLYYRYPADTAQVERQRQRLLASWGIDYEFDQAMLGDSANGQGKSALMQKALTSEKLVGASLPALAKTLVKNHQPLLHVEKKQEFYLDVCQHLVRGVEKEETVKVTDSEFRDAQAGLSLVQEILDEEASHDQARELRVEMRSKLDNIRYQDWIKNHGLQEIDGQLFAERMMLQWNKKPSFHFTMFLLNGEEALLADSLDSIIVQMYPTWRLSVVAEAPCPDVLWEETAALDWVQCGEEQDPYQLMNEVVEAVNADWVSFIEPGMTLEPHTLLQFGDYINLRGDWKFIYCDHDVVDLDGLRSKPEFKPDFNLDMLRSTPYFGRAAMVHQETLKKLDGFSALPELEMHDCALRVYESYGDEVIGHIPDVIWHRSGASTRHIEDQLLAHVTQEHLTRSGIPSSTGPGYAEGAVRVQYALEQEPSVSIIIPSQNRAEFLDSCVSSVFDLTDYKNFEVVVAAAESKDPELQAVYDELIARYGERLRIVYSGAEFSFSRLANAGVRQARGDYLLFLGAESEIVQAQWLSRMLTFAARSDVAAVGARIIFPETSRINHAGVVLGRDGAAGYVFREDWALRDVGYASRLQIDQNYSAVSGSCMMLSAELFSGIGGFAEVTFEINYADVDLCLKLSDLGLRHVWTPYATVVQHGNIDEKDDELSRNERQLKLVGKWHRERAALLKAWLPRLANDPAYNPNLDLSHGSYRVDNNLPRNWDTNFHDRIRVLGMPIKGGSGDYRVIQPFNALSEAGMQQCEHYRLGDSEKRSLSITEVARLKPDTVVVQAAIDDLQIKLIEEISEYMPNVHRVCTLDDLVTDVPEKSSVYKNSMRFFRDSKSRMRRLLSQCDRLIVTTQSLADAYAELIDDIQVVPNRLSRKLWVGHESLRRQGEKPRVGWVGAQQHQGDLELVFDVVKALADDVDWVFMGMCPDEIKPYVKEYVGFVPIEEYPKKMASLNLDLAIAPLEVHAFNESKSNLRLLEYGAMGWPVVCTDIYSYRTNDAPVVRVPNETQAWIDAIRKVLADPVALAAAGDALKQWVLDHYILEDHLVEWECALTPKHLLGTVPATPNMVRSAG